MRGGLWCVWCGGPWCGARCVVANAWVWDCGVRMGAHGCAVWACGAHRHHAVGSCGRGVGGNRCTCGDCVGVLYWRGVPCVGCYGYHASRGVWRGGRSWCGVVGVRSPRGVVWLGACSIALWWVGVWWWVVGGVACGALWVACGGCGGVVWGVWGVHTGTHGYTASGGGAVGGWIFAATEDFAVMRRGATRAPPLDVNPVVARSGR